MKLNDITNRFQPTYFNDLKAGEYFIQNLEVIWMKVDVDYVQNNKTLKALNAIQITNNTNYPRYGLFKNDSKVDKIDIISIDYEKIK